jgi:hypothetical protein
MLKKDGEKQFLSANFIDNLYNDTATILSFAMLDLPLSAEAAAGQAVSH